MRVSSKYLSQSRVNDKIICLQINYISSFMPNNSDKNDSTPKFRSLSMLFPEKVVITGKSI